MNDYTLFGPLFIWLTICNSRYGPSDRYLCELRNIEEVKTLATHYSMYLAGAHMLCSFNFRKVLQNIPEKFILLNLGLIHRLLLSAQLIIVKVVVGFVLKQKGF